MTHILLVISDPNVGMVLSEYLRLREFSVDFCSTPSDAFSAAMKARYDFCVLGLDDKDACLLLITDIRRTSDTPLFVLQTTFDKDQQLAFYNAGADDCLVQPLVPELLICKMNAMSRRWNDYQAALPTVFTYPNVQFDSVTQTLSVGKTVFQLSTKETGVLLLLFRNANQLVERSRILKDVWLADNYFNARSLSVYINRLRHYIEPNSPLRIVSMRLRGYKLLIPS